MLPLSPLAWALYVFCQSDRDRTAVQPQHSSANSTRDRFWHELILPRLDKTLSLLFLLLCYLYYPKMWASKNLCPGASWAVPFLQQYSLRNSSFSPLLQAFHLGKPIVYGEKPWL